ncbi:MAG: hypothetical protein EBY30_08935, partial [Rhodospirillales bacterium]|nr:hypothetical protein [Rhodospirillales bacterium]
MRMRRGEDMAAIMRQVSAMAGLALGFMAMAPAAKAGPWPQAEGGGQLLISTSFQHLNVQGYDTQGRPSGRGSLDQLSVSPYWEHGLTQRWTIGIQPRLQASWMDLGYSRSNGVGLADAALFARYAVWRDNGMVLSLQGTAVTPGTASTDSPRIAEANGSVEGRALFGISRAIGSINAFMGLEGAYRLRFGSNADEVRLDATIGFRPADGWFVFAQSLNTLGLRNATGTGANYSAYKASLAVSYSVTPQHSIVAAYTRDLGGRNVALGDSYTL